MFDIGWSEIVIIAAIALIIIGPKDLPKVLHTMGQWIGKAKGMAREFQDSLDEVIRDAELDQVKKQIQSVANSDVKGMIEKAVDGDGTLRDAFTFDGDAGTDTKPGDIIEAESPDAASGADGTAQLESEPPKDTADTPNTKADS